MIPSWPQQDPVRNFLWLVWCYAMVRLWSAGSEIRSVYKVQRICDKNELTQRMCTSQLISFGKIGCLWKGRGHSCKNVEQNQTNNAPWHQTSVSKAVNRFLRWRHFLEFQIGANVLRIHSVDSQILWWFSGLQKMFFSSHPVGSNRADLIRNGKMGIIIQKSDPSFLTDKHKID